MADDTKERYINPYTDFGFKKLFGTEMNKDLLISFLNALFHDEQVIKDVKYLNSEKLGEGYGDRKAIFDVYCENEDGEKFIVEMQKVEQRYFKDRSVFYSTFPIREQGRRGSDWDFNLKIAKFSPEERQDYEESVKIYRDLKNSLDTAEWKAKVKIAKNFKTMGLSNEQIAKGTGLPLNEILSL